MYNLLCYLHISRSKISSQSGGLETIMQFEVALNLTYCILYTVHRLSKS